MANETPYLRVVGPEKQPRFRRPGPAVLVILLYAFLFGAALWYRRARSPLFHKSGPAGPVKPQAAVAAATRENQSGGAGARTAEAAVTRDRLLSGEGLTKRARDAYFQHLAADRCDCGCARTLSDCLANEKSCRRSPDLAGKWIRSLSTRTE